jgi:hypothetical protein
MTKTLLPDSPASDIIGPSADNPELFVPGWEAMPGRPIVHLARGADLLIGSPTRVRVLRHADGRGGELRSYDIPLTPLPLEDPFWPGQLSSARRSNCVSCGHANSDFSLQGMSGSVCQGCVTAATEMLRAIDERRAAGTAA